MKLLRDLWNFIRGKRNPEVAHYKGTTLKEEKKEKPMEEKDFFRGGSNTINKSRKPRSKQRERMQKRNRNINMRKNKKHRKGKACNAFNKI